MFKKGTGYSKAGLVLLMLVCRSGKEFYSKIVIFLSLAKTLSQSN